MGKCSIEYKELRFVIENELTQVYILCDAIGDCPLGVQGWHHKTFPKSVNIADILSKMFTGADRDDPVMWPQKAPA